MSISHQCELLGIKRSTYCYRPKGESPENKEFIRHIDAQFLESPFYRTRQMRRHLRQLGYSVERRRVKRLMCKIGRMVYIKKPKTSSSHPQHIKYPYLLRGLKIDSPNQVWCADITNIPMQRGHLNLAQSWTGTAVQCFPGNSRTR